MSKTKDAKKKRLTFAVDEKVAGLLELLPHGEYTRLASVVETFLENHCKERLGQLKLPESSKK